MNDILVPALSLISATILCLISLLHFYWAADGKWGIQAALPEAYKTPFFDPENKLITNIAAIIIGIGLACFAVIVINNVYPLEMALLDKYGKIMTLIVGVIFLARAVGDFNLFGLFRKKRQTLFNEMDRKMFVPLCLFLGISCVIIGM